MTQSNTRWDETHYHQAADISQERREEERRPAGRWIRGIPRCLCGILFFFMAFLLHLMRMFLVQWNDSLMWIPQSQQNPQYHSICAQQCCCTLALESCQLVLKTRTFVHSNHSSVLNGSNAAFSHSLEIACSTGVLQSLAMSAEK